MDIMPDSGSGGRGSNPLGRIGGLAQWQGTGFENQQEQSFAGSSPAPTAFFDLMYKKSTLVV